MTKIRPRYSFSRLLRDRVICNGGFKLDHANVETQIISCFQFACAGLPDDPLVRHFDFLACMLLLVTNDFLVQYISTCLNNQSNC